MAGFKEEVNMEMWRQHERKFQEKVTGIGKDTEAEGAECGECRHSCDGVSGSVRNEVGSLAE